MMPSRLLLVPVLACSSVLLTGGLNQKAAPSAPSPLPTGIEPLDLAGKPGGGPALQAAAEAFAPERVPWMQMTLWQRVRCEDCCYEAQGHYLAAPGNRLRLDLHVQVGQTKGELQIISSGSGLSCASRVDPDAAPAVTHVDFEQKPDQPRQDPERILQEHGCPAVAPLLRMVCACLQDPCWKLGRWNGHEVVELAGVWRSAQTSPAGMPNLEQAAQLRHCRVYLDARTLWPYRLEWWGPAPGQGRALPLVEVEYRDPVLNQALSAEVCAREFTRTAAAASCTDRRPGPGSAPRTRLPLAAAENPARSPK
jgi:hypothetical protein